MRRTAAKLCCALLVAGVFGVAASNACAQLYWDSDANVGNNDIGTGAGLGGSGVWSNTSANWFSGSADTVWIPASDAVISGVAGLVVLTDYMSANSVSF